MAAGIEDGLLDLTGLQILVNAVKEVLLTALHDLVGTGMIRIRMLHKFLLLQVVIQVCVWQRVREIDHDLIDTLPDIVPAAFGMAVLFLSGAAMGLNWVLLFEAYNHTTVATATLCYYMAPVFVILVSPFIFGEKLGLKKVFCVLCAVLGMFFVSGFFESGFGGAAELKGVIFGISAAVLYSAVVILNKKTAKVPSFEKTLVQLGSAAITVLPYILLKARLHQNKMNIHRSFL